jgi:hypothetical protein
MLPAMRIVCLCPTYGRPRRLIENTLACFLAQDHPANLRRMLILDDAGLITPQQGAGWEVHSTPNRFRDDDDVYLPWHLSAHAQALESHAWSHPREVWSNYTGEVRREGAAGRFHGALAIRRDLVQRIGGWIGSLRADFDQQQIAVCQQLTGDPGRPDDNQPPSYVFRWSSTQAPHGQNLMKSPDDETWYARATINDTSPVRSLDPKLDADAQHILATTKWH